MRALFALLLLAVFCTAGCSRGEKTCAPSFRVLDPPISIDLGDWEVSFSLVAVGCESQLASTWPPNSERLTAALVRDLQELHPVETVVLINDNSPKIRRLVTEALNQVLGGGTVSDVFLFKPRAAEGL